MPPVSPQQIEDALRNLSRVGRLVRREQCFELWSAELAGREWHVRFYLRSAAPNLAIREFAVLQSLQKAKIPAPRVIAHLAGFRLDALVGDAIIIEPFDDAISLHHHLRSATPRERHRVAVQLADILSRLREAFVRFDRPSIDCFRVRAGTLLLTSELPGDLQRGTMSTRDAHRLAWAFDDIASRTELLRAWRALIKLNEPLPARNVFAPESARQIVRRARTGGVGFGGFEADGWQGWFVAASMFPRPWSLASRLELTEPDWQREWPILKARIESDQLETLKDEPSGEVLTGEIHLAGRPVRVIVKRPMRKQRWRAMFNIGWYARAPRTWLKAWHLVALGLPTEHPLLLMQRKTGPIVQDALLVSEMVPGTILARLSLASLSTAHRRTLLHRCGATLRRIEQFGLSHFDAKSYNWIVTTDPDGSPRPVMIDLDGIRRYRWQGRGMERLVRAIRQHSDRTDADLVHLARGYAPFARLEEISRLIDLSLERVRAIEGERA